MYKIQAFIRDSPSISCAEIYDLSLFALEQTHRKFQENSNVMNVNRVFYIQ